ncbi:MAG: TlpA family protein disulfide reductase, partial [SAR202 cluster bacterium]|nr:TlpA family protein disulfide reductase [SAR202 cluster bacterium]
MTTQTPRSSHSEPDDAIEVIEECYRLGWSDGLPVVPPVEYKVREMLQLNGMTGEEELLSLEMRRRVLTSENAAANAVMAGCLPEYFPVLVATLRALDEEKNFVHMASASTSSPSILTVVNGPIRHQINLNSRDGLLGPGWRANATLGRAVRLCFMNGFDARPGTLDRGTLGNPTKYTFCIADNEEDSPWGALHVSRGFQPQDSCV